MDRYDTFWRRLCAGFVDGLVFSPLSFLGQYLGSPERGVAVLICWSVVFYSSYWLYSVLLHARFGQTLGKMAAGVRVLNVSEERLPSLRQAFMRDVGYIVLNVTALIYVIYLILVSKYGNIADVATLPNQIIGWAGLGWFGLEVVTMLTNRKRRAFHDYIAGTVVIK